MTIQYEVFKKHSFRDQQAFDTAESMAVRLRDHLNEDHIQRLLEKRHVVGASSSDIQDIIIGEACALGFQSEKKGLFSEYAVASLRPDCYRPIGNTGVILEVERGKTTANNMDLLDFWKCHICPSAEFLFLVVPKLRPNNNGTSTQQFSRVAKRLAPFFEAQNYVNVEAAFLFGY